MTEGGCQLSEYHYYRCKNGDCIKKQWRCDREKDCVGGDDEQDCGELSSLIHKLTGNESSIISNFMVLSNVLFLNPDHVAK